MWARTWPKRRVTLSVHPSFERSWLKKFECTDQGNVERLLAFCGDRFRYVPTWERFMVWDGKRWCPDPRGAKVAWLASELPARIHGEWMLAEDKDEKDRLWTWYMRSQGAGRAKAVVDWVRGWPAAEAKAEDFDANPMLFNASNGTLDLRSGKLRHFNPKDKLTCVSGVSFDPDAQAPKWESFLETVLPDEEVRKWLQAFVGYCLTGSVKERRIVVFYGLGRNGKSVLLRVLHELLGPYAGTIRPDMLLTRGTEPHPTEEAALFGKRLVVTSEVRKNRSFDEEKVKGLTGGDVRAARRMHEDFWDLKPTAKIIVAANHRPNVKDCTDSFWDRMVLVPFKVRIADDQVDKDLLDKLLAERSGILNWALEGCRRWQSDGLVMPTALLESGAAYRAVEDRMAEFFAECLDFTSLGRMTHAEVMAIAKNWYESNNLYCPSDKAFGERLIEAGVERYRSHGVRYLKGVMPRKGRGKAVKPPTDAGCQGDMRAFTPGKLPQVT